MRRLGVPLPDGHGSETLAEPRASASGTGNRGYANFRSLALAVLMAIAAAAFAQAPNPNSQYRLGPDSLPQDGVPRGEIRGPYTLPSKVYPGTQHTYWIYVPAQYDAAVPASLMIFQDGPRRSKIRPAICAPKT